MNYLEKLYEDILLSFDITLEQNQFTTISWFFVKIHNGFFYFCKNQKHSTSFRSRFPVKSICCVASESVSSACSLLKSIAILF